jgi:hypothetical protein
MDYKKFSLKQLDLMFAALPIGNVNKEDLAAEIESRVLKGEKNKSQLKFVRVSKKQDTIQKALETLQLS